MQLEPREEINVGSRKDTRFFLYLVASLAWEQLYALGIVCLRALHPGVCLLLLGPPGTYAAFTYLLRQTETIRDKRMKLLSLLLVIFRGPFITITITINSPTALTHAPASHVVCLNSTVSFVGVRSAQLSTSIVHYFYLSCASLIFCSRDGSLRLNFDFPLKPGLIKFIYFLVISSSFGWSHTFWTIYGHMHVGAGKVYELAQVPIRICAKGNAVGFGKIFGNEFVARFTSNA